MGSQGEGAVYEKVVVDYVAALMWRLACCTSHVPALTWWLSRGRRPRSGFTMCCCVIWCHCTLW